ncbi:TIGR02302 family protein [Geminicoccus roseus]|uniref:TIGR02302 family protein n=1 Tax=Geminicoccus roseus TaxID=404900 RepID=UPI000410F89C|nr:TIGR02302 family protein [Geminicoccus roseus]
MDGAKHAARLPRRLNRAIRAARLFVDVEQLWAAARWPLLVLCLFLILALAGILPRLPAALHALVLAGFAGSFLYAGYRAFRGFRPAGRSQALQRLEADSGFSHAPLQGLDDRLAGGGDDPFTRALWKRHQARLAVLAEQTRLTPPRSQLPRLDPWAIRAAVVLLLAVALVDAEGRIGQRLTEALVPGVAAREGAEAITATLWIEPPAYTRLPPRMIEAGGERTIVPIGSQALLQVHHLPPGEAAPAVVFEGTSLAATRLGEASAEARLDVLHDGDLIVQGEEGAEIARFLLAAQPDRRPGIRSEGEPAITLRNALEIGWSGDDDYGLVSVALEIEPVEGGRAPERIALKSLPEQPREAKGRSYLDTTPHPLAGAQVRLVLVAVDAAGQEGRSEPIVLTLPERSFEHPVARAIIEQRKDLAADPQEREAVADVLDQLAGTQMMEDLPASVPLSLNSAAERLRRGEISEAELESVLEQLWETALFVEEGQMATAERDMRRLQEELERALAEGRDDTEIERLMDELQEAMNRYLDELTRQALAEAMRDPEALERALRQQLEQPPGAPDPNMVDRQDLQDMLDRAREMLKSGSREAAEQMLSQLREMMENLQAQLPMPQGAPTPGEQALSDLQEAIRRQQMLQDEAFRMDRQMNGAQQPGQEGQEGQQGQEGQPQMTPQQLAQLQEMLRRELGRIMEGLAEQGMELPDQLGQAELQMRGAEGQLQQGSPGAATDPQGQAMALMQEAGRGIMDQMREQMGQGQGQGPGRASGSQPGMPGRDRAGWQRDPLGRSQEGMGGADTDSTAVPDEAALGRARAVLEELYRRSGDPRRPRMELDYYDRLLERF